MKDINKYEGIYKVTEDGRIYSVKRNKFLKHRVITNKNNRSKEHVQCAINLYKDGKRKSYLIHRLVALAYIPNSENKPDINHKDGNPLNNNVDNLEWCTKSENMQHAIKNGLVDYYTEKQILIRSNNGKKMGRINSMKSRRKFTFTEAELIRKLHEVGKYSRNAISKAYKCSSKTIDNICNYRTYLQEA